MANAAPWAQPIWRQPTEATKTTKPHSCGVQHRVPQTSRVIWGTKFAPWKFSPFNFHMPQANFGKNMGNKSVWSEIHPRSLPLSLQSSSYFFESSQRRWPWQLHRIYDSGLTHGQATSSDDASWIGCKECLKRSWIEGYQSNKNQLESKASTRTWDGTLIMLNSLHKMTTVTGWEALASHLRIHCYLSVLEYTTSFILGEARNELIRVSICVCVCYPNWSKSTQACQICQCTIPKVMMQKPGIESWPKCLCRPLYCITQ